MVTMSWMSPMPCSLMSSSRPMKGLTHQAPALAARRAWLGEKHSVTLTLIPSVASATLCFSPSQALLAAKAGAWCVSPFIGRLDDISEHGMGLIQDIVTIYRNYQ